MKKIIAFTLSLIMLVSMAGCRGPETVMQYGKSSVTTDMYTYWLASFKLNILRSYNNLKDTDEFWDGILEDGVTTENYFNDIITTQVKYFTVGQELFRNFGLRLSAETKKSIKDDINEKITYYGSRAELNSELGKFGVNISILEKVYTAQEKLNAVYDYLFGDGGAEEITPEELETYYNDNYCRIKYIVLYRTKLVLDADGKYTYDSDGNIKTEDMTAEELAAVDAEAKKIIAAAEAGDDFDTLMKAYSDYDTSETYPNGLFISANELSTYGAQMITASHNTEIGGFARVDEELATYIVSRIELTDIDDISDADLEQIADLENYCTQEKYDRIFSQYATGVTVNEEIYNGFSLRDAVMSTSSNF